MLFDFTNEQLEACANGENLDLPAVPLHSQTNEFFVSRVSEASSLHNTFEKQHQHVLVASSNREKRKLESSLTFFNFEAKSLMF